MLVYIPSKEIGGKVVINGDFGKILLCLFGQLARIVI
jgi:hypothetical protein